MSQSGSPAPDGTLRLGRQGKAQFYGLIDDVAVYNRSMDPAGITNLMNSPISGTHPNLIAAFTFDTYTPGILVPVPKYLATPNARAFSVHECPPAQQQRQRAVRQSLPGLSECRRPPPAVLDGADLEVNHEFDDKGGSHNGTAAFCWDFVRLDAATTQDPVIAAAPGLLSYVNDSANGAGVIEVVPGQEADVYMHTAGGSWWEEFLAPGNYPTLPATRRNR